MTLRKFASVFFILYGILIPILAWDFTSQYFLASIAIIFSCWIIAILLLLKRCDFLNLIIAFYVFKIYLTRPYVDIFLQNLSYSQARYIEANNIFFNASDAIIVYFSILSLLVAWLVGLLIALPRNKNTPGTVLPKIFRQLDTLIARADWRFWLVFSIMLFLNYVPASVAWQGIGYGGESQTLFAFGVTNPNMIGIVCLLTFLFYLSDGGGKKSWLLLLPALYSIFISTSGGSRGGAFLIFVYSFLCLIILNYDKQIMIRMKAALTAIATVILVPIVIFAGLVAQTLRPLLRTAGIEDSGVMELFMQNINIFDPENVISKTFYFGLTEILHRLSALEAQFYVLGDHFINSPWETFNPLTSFMRALNDLVPGSLFPDMLTINQVFHHIYFDQSIQYSSHMWGIQSTLYLYLGFWLSPILLIYIGYVLANRWNTINNWIKSSPAFMVFIMLLSLAILENATFERILSVDIVRPLVSFLVLIFSVRLLYVLFPKRNQLT